MQTAAAQMRSQTQIISCQGARHTSVQIKDGAEVILDQPVPVRHGQQKEMRGLSDCAQGAGSAAMR